MSAPPADGAPSPGAAPARPAPLRQIPLRHIEVVGAREHNLKGFSLALPRDSLVVITGLSGSGKSSLAFDTIYQEGQRRFMESLSAYARQFLGKMEKPRVERVDGLSPTLCIDQKTVNRNPRSTVGTITEILDHLRLLMARLGAARCPECLRPIATSTPGQLADSLLRDAPMARLHVMAPIIQDRKGEYRKELAEALANGWLRARIDGELRSLEEPITLARYEKHTIELVVDRLRARPDDRPRLVEAIERAHRLTGSTVSLLVEPDAPDAAERPTAEHRLFALDRSCPEHGISIPEVEPRLFSFNAPQGMCLRCQGIGFLEDFDLSLLIDPAAPFETALRLLREEERLPFSSVSREVVAEVGKRLKIAPGTPWSRLSAEQTAGLLGGAEVRYAVTKEREAGSTTTHQTWAGFLPILQHIWEFTHLPRLATYRRRLSCPACAGHRLNPVALAVDFRGQGIAALSHLSVTEALRFFGEVRLKGNEEAVGKPILSELLGRLRFLDAVGLGYLTLDRPAATLSGGEGQRIRLASQVGAALQGVTYVLDEPSIGLHPRDQERLLDALLRLRDQGNSVLVVEHDAATMARADYLVEIGPGAGREGGELVAAGPRAEFLASSALTARFLRGEERIDTPAHRRPGTGKRLRLRGATANNLRGVDVEIPLGTLTVFTGVSGSGKSSLVEHTLYKALAQRLHGSTVEPGPHTGIDGIEELDKVVQIDQAPIGRTPRSNPVTYTGAFDPIRDLFADLPEARARGYKKGRFSFNVAGGRCEECEGAGVKTVEMQFLADVEVPCESCDGRRFNPETLELRYRGHTITEVLEMTIAEAAVFFQHHRRIRRVMQTLVDVGLGYVSLGQPSTTLSGGEAQRIKLATELARPATGRTLYILDEPTTGLHMADVRRLLVAMQRLVEAGNTVLVIEHNTDVIKVADHLIDLGPEGGVGGGLILAVGTPERLALEDSPTGRVLRAVLAEDAAMAPLWLAESASPRWETAASPAAPSDPRFIRLRGVRTHNLKNIDVDLPQGKMTVITGPSGSGKTSLAFDTLFAEGQRRYVESLSTYARRFLGRLDRASLDRAEGLAPAIAIDQRSRGANPRSTVATVTEAYDTLRLLYARVGQPHCPRCARPIVAWSPSHAARALVARAPGPGWVLAELPEGSRVADLRREGFSRAWSTRAATEVELDALIAEEGEEAVLDGHALVIDRLDPERAGLERLAEAIGAAYGWGRDRCRFRLRQGGEELPFARAAECPQHGRVLQDELNPRHFSFNHHQGACPACAGLGRRAEIDLELLLPEPHKRLELALDGRVGATLYRAPRNRHLIEAVFEQTGTPAETPVKDWSPALRQAMLYGVEGKLKLRYVRRWGRTVTKVEEEQDWQGILAIIEGWEAASGWLRRESPCSACGGARLRPEPLAVTIGDAPSAQGPRGLNIAAACALTVEAALTFWTELRLSPNDTAIAEQALDELRGKLRFLLDVGLGYLSLDRPAETLSGGESQRIRLATQLGARLTGTIYVLDEPTIGLHPRDTARLLGTLRGLRDLGNTLVVVEHDPEVIRAADHVIDMGPGAGEHGGRVVDQGTPGELCVGPGLTGAYLSGRLQISAPAARRSPRAWLELPASSLHNLKGVTARLPLGCLTAVTGVSGSGKSTLIMDHVAPILSVAAGRKVKKGEPPPLRLVVVDQQPIGRSPRSTPATYCELLGPIRDLFAETQGARERGWGPSWFTFNGTEGGRCRPCEGRGTVQIEMHFLSDVQVTCEACGGRRFSPETLEVRWKGLSIADVLDLPVDEALDLFSAHRALKKRLQALSDVGLGYVRLGQPGTTLSGGEAQRVKLAGELMSRSTETLYLLDEPTTGLHLADVDRLVGVLHRLVDAGHSVLVIEHHLDVIRNADHVIELGPDGGAAGGQLVAEGPPDHIAAQDTATGEALRAVNGGSTSTKRSRGSRQTRQR